jgi:hypothetical protein
MVGAGAEGADEDSGGSARLFSGQGGGDAVDFSAAPCFSGRGTEAELAERPERSAMVTAGQEPAVCRVEDGCGGRSYLPSRKSSSRLGRTGRWLAADGKECRRLHG